MMSWLKFTLWLGSIYCLYYLIIIFFDILAGGRSQPGGAMGTELTFEEEIEPVRPDMEKLMPLDTDLPDEKNRPRQEQFPALRSDNIPASPVISSGGVTLKQLFSLARLEAIEFTHPVSF
jgi:hypothetical protein